MKNFETVCSAWDGDKLVGLISAMDDGVMTAYVHYLLVDPAYQHQVYESCGFKKTDDASPMFITSLWT